MQVLEKIEAVGSKSGKTSQKVLIHNCGEVKASSAGTSSKKKRDDAPGAATAAEPSSGSKVAKVAP